jgi:hypothetical protein
MTVSPVATGSRSRRRLTPRPGGAAGEPEVSRRVHVARAVSAGEPEVSRETMWSAQ